MKPICFAVNLILMTMLTARATESLKPNDFAAGLEIKTTGNEALYEIEVPPQVYQGVVKPDLGDMRVFNNSGNVVPSMITEKENKENVLSPERSLPFFPMTSYSQEKLNDLSLKIERKENGSVINLKSTKGNENEAQIIFYLVDASLVDEGIEGLRLNWTVSEKNFLGHITVEGGNDFKHWTPLAQEASLARFEQDGNQLEKNEISFLPHHFKYFRLSWPSDEKAVELTGIKAILTPVTREQEPHWITIESATPKEKTDQINYVFDIGGFFPVDRFQLELPYQNTLLQANMSALMNGEVSRFLYKGFFYRLNLKGQEMKNSTIRIPITTSRVWTASFPLKEETLRSQEDLSLKVGYYPQKIVFLAQGDGPFLLAYGNAVVEPLSSMASPLLMQFGVENSPASAELGKSITLGGAEKLTPPPPLPEKFPWNKLILWSVLILGVIVLMFISIRLLKQTNMQR